MIYALNFIFILYNMSNIINFRANIKAYIIIIDIIWSLGISTRTINNNSKIKDEKDSKPIALFNRLIEHLIYSWWPDLQLLNY